MQNGGIQRSPSVKVKLKIYIDFRNVLSLRKYLLILSCYKIYLDENEIVGSKRIFLSFRDDQVLQKYVKLNYFFFIVYAYLHKLIIIVWTLPICNKKKQK